MDFNLTGTIATNISLMQPTRTDYNPIIVGLFTLIGAVIGQYLQFRSEERKQQEKEKEQITRQNARLGKLMSFLRASEVSFLVQAEARDRLLEMINTNHPDFDRPEYGYEMAFSRAYPSFTESERGLHDIIRGITIHNLRPMNESMLNLLHVRIYY